MVHSQKCWRYQRFYSRIATVSLTQTSEKKNLDRICRISQNYQLATMSISSTNRFSAPPSLVSVSRSFIWAAATSGGGSSPWNDYVNVCLSGERVLRVSRKSSQNNETAGQGKDRWPKNSLFFCLFSPLPSRPRGFRNVDWKGDRHLICISRIHRRARWNWSPSCTLRSRDLVPSRCGCWWASLRWQRLAGAVLMGADGTRPACLSRAQHSSLFFGFNWSVWLASCSFKNEVKAEAKIWNK